jgi:hypothetical protein
MKKFFSRRNVLLAFLAVVLLTVAWFESASIRGRWAARFDLARGHYAILGYGLPPAAVAEYKQILRERYGVEYRQVALCIVSHSLVSYADAYDEVSEAAIRQKFGQDVFKNSWDEATKKWQDSHKAELQTLSQSE